MRFRKRLRSCALGLLICALGACVLCFTSVDASAADTEPDRVSTAPPTRSFRRTSGHTAFGEMASPDSIVRRLARAMPTSVPVPTVDWSQMVVRMSPGTVEPGNPVVVPPAPPLALPEPTPVSPTAVATQVPVAAVIVPSSANASRGQVALNRIGFDLASVGYTISFHAHTGSHRGLTFTGRRHIEVYVRSSMSDGELAYVIAHEMGHAVDHIRNTNNDRARWRTARGMAPSAAWWPSGVGTDFATPAGDFAECFASWAAGSGSHSAWGGCGPVMGLLEELAYS